MQTIVDVLEATLKVEKEWSEEGADVKNLRENMMLQLQIGVENSDAVFTD